MAQAGTGKYTYELIRDFCKLRAFQANFRRPDSTALRRPISATPSERYRKFADSPLEGDGFELSVPAPAKFRFASDSLLEGEGFELSVPANSGSSRSAGQGQPHGNALHVRADRGAAGEQAPAWAGAATGRADRGAPPRDGQPRPG